MGDLKNRKLIVLKGVLFFLMLSFAIATLVALTRDWLIGALVILVAWLAMRFYYFLFYVLERYVDPRLKYAGVFALIVAIARRPASGDPEGKS